MDRNHQKYNRSISGFSATDEVIDDALPGIIQSGLEECWKDELFFDVEIITCDGSVKSHKIVLASISPFFRATFSPLHQLSNEVGSNKIDLQIFSTLTVKKILQYVYTKKQIYESWLKIWIRRWDGRPVYGALAVLYSDGSKVFHGERSNHEVYEFILDPDEFIVEIVAYSGYMIDNLLFITNTGKEYGPYGGDGGGRRVLKAPSKSGYLSYISGNEAFTQGSLGLVELAFHWMYYVKSGQGANIRANKEPTLKRKALRMKDTKETSL
eukprot:gene948-10713_t